MSEIPFHGLSNATLTLAAQQYALRHLSREDGGYPGPERVVWRDTTPMTSEPKQSLAEVRLELTAALECVTAGLQGIRTNKEDSCAHNLVRGLQSLDDDGLQTFFQEKLSPSTSNYTLAALLDALGSVGSAASQAALVEVATETTSTNDDMSFRALLSLGSSSAVPSTKTLMLLEAFCFGSATSPQFTTLTDSRRQATLLVLAKLTRHMREASTDVEAAGSVVTKIELELSEALPGLELHDEAEKDALDHHHSILLLALGNAGSNSSAPHILPHIHESATLRRRAAGLRALRYLKGQTVEDVLLEHALFGTDNTTRHAARSSYSHRESERSKPLVHVEEAIADFRAGVLPNVTLAPRRDRRGLIPDSWLERLGSLRFDLSLPSVVWEKSVGSDMLGAGMGLIVINSAKFEQQQLVSNFQLHVHDEAYAGFHFLQLQANFFKVRLCQITSLRFDLNVAKWVGLDKAQQLVEGFDRIVSTVRDDIVAGFDKVWQWIRSLDEENPIEKFVDAVERIPTTFGHNAMARLDAALSKAWDIPEAQAITAVVEAAAGLYHGARADILVLYATIHRAVAIDLPEAFQKIGRAGRLVQSVLGGMLLRNPLQAIESVAEAIRSVMAAFSIAKAAVTSVRDAFHLQDGWPVWTRKEVYASLYEQLRQSIADLAAVVSSPSANQAKQVLLNELKNALEETVAGGVFAAFQDLTSAVVEPFEAIVALVDTVKNLPAVAKESYERARTLINSVFGPKFEKRFAEEVRGCSNACGCGPYPSTGDSRYGQGVGLVVPAQSKDAFGDTADSGNIVLAPVEAVVSWVSDDDATVVLRPFDGTWNSYKITLFNVRPLVDVGDEVQAGQLLGVVDQTDCGPRAIHLSMTSAPDDTYGAEDDAVGPEVVDPTQFIQVNEDPRPILKNECDDYHLEWLGDTLASGQILGLKPQTVVRPLQRKPQSYDVPDVGLGEPSEDPSNCGSKWFCKRERRRRDVKDGTASSRSHLRIEQSWKKGGAEHLRPRRSLLVGSVERASPEAALLETSFDMPDAPAATKFDGKLDGSLKSAQVWLKRRFGMSRSCFDG